MIGDIRAGCVVAEPRTVIEAARRAAGLSQRAVGRDRRRTQQSSVSEYESRRKSPTLDVVERLLDAAITSWRPSRWCLGPCRGSRGRFVLGAGAGLWSVPLPKCFARVQAFKYVFPAEADPGWDRVLRMWDLSATTERIDYYGSSCGRGMVKMVEDSVDGVLLIQAWPQMTLPLPGASGVAASSLTGPRSTRTPPPDPGRCERVDGRGGQTSDGRCRSGGEAPYRVRSAAFVVESFESSQA